jgi:hypothetical protein
LYDNGQKVANGTSVVVVLVLVVMVMALPGGAVYG